jgi:hypothetical protein
MNGRSHRGTQSHSTVIGAVGAIAVVSFGLALDVAACASSGSAPSRSGLSDGSAVSDGSGLSDGPGSFDGGNGAPETSTPMDGGSTGDGPATDGSFASACAAYASAFCAQDLACFPFYFKNGTFGTTQTCLDVVTTRCVDESSAPGSTWTVAQRIACASTQTTCDAVWWNTPAPCRAPGTLPLGAPCMHDTQCASTLCGGKASYGACGTCQAAGALDAGCDRTQTDNPCAQGLVCADVCQAPSFQGGPCPSSEASRCVAPAAQGAACSDSSDCVGGLTCIGLKCVQKQPTGQPCGWTLDCAGEALCDNGQCTAVTYATTGMPCSTTAQIGPPCLAQDLCVGQCARRLGDGGTCTTTQECSPGLTCAGGACKFVAASSCH